MSSSRVSSIGVALCLLVGLIGGLGAGPATAADERLRVMFVGDSITQGRQGDATYRFFVWQEFARQQVPVTFVGPYDDLSKTRGLANNYLRTDLGFETAHASKASSKFPSHLKHLDAYVRTYRPDVIALMLGYNDAGKASALAIAINTVKYLERTWSIDPQVRFVLGEITSAYRFSRAKASSRNDVTSVVNTLLRLRYAGDPRVSIAANVTDPVRPWDPAEYSYDGVHPNLAGQSLLGYHFSRAFADGGFLRGAPARPVSPVWTVQPRVESVSVAAPRGRTKRAVVLRWPTQSRRIYVKGFRLVVQRPNGNVVALQDSASANQARVSLRPGTYRARLIAWRGPMVSTPGPVKQFRVR